MNDKSLFLRLNTTDFQKLLKGAGIATGGIAVVFILGVFNIVNAAAVTAVYTAMGGIVVNFLVKLLNGPRE